MYAITPFGIGKPVGARSIRPDWPLADGETFTVEDYESGMVLGTDEQSVEMPSEPIQPVPTTISDRQFFQALAGAGLISEAEALAAVKTGDIPAALEVFVAALPEGERFSATMLLSGAVEFRRDHPLTAAFAAAQGWTDAQVDDLWRSAAAL